MVFVVNWLLLMWFCEFGCILSNWRIYGLDVCFNFNISLIISRKLVKKYGIENPRNLPS